MDLHHWLERHALAHLEPLLARAGVDRDVLGDLTRQDLMAIGVSLGDAVRLQKSIAAEPASAGDAEAPQRRQLTVLFADLVGSTVLSRRLDPEDLQLLIGRYHQAVIAAVGPFGGHVAQLLGDGVLVYFGYPHAHEDDAERAVRAALAIRDALKSISEGAAGVLRTRVGIATGPVVVAQVGGGTRAAEQAASGETPNLAARLQAAAAPGEIIVASSTRSLLGDVFELKACEPLALKGFDAPQTAWSVQGVRGHESRFQAVRGSLAPLFGRADELARLRACWSDVEAGGLRCVLVSGEAGIGKSRLALEIQNRLTEQGAAAVLWQCSPYFSSSAFHPVHQQILRAAGVLAHDAPDERGGKVRRLLEHLALPVATADTIIRALDRESGGPLLLDTTPQLERAERLAALLAMLQAGGRSAPLLLVVEDAHWIDTSTEELLSLVVGQRAGLAALVIVTARPEYVPAWGSDPYLHLELPRLRTVASSAVVEAIDRDRALPPVLVQRILEKADGIPLFIEALARTLLDSPEVIRSAGAQGPGEDAYASIIPATLQDSLMARLDRLGPARRVAQAAAAIGREFGQELLAAAAGVQAPEVIRALHALTNAGLAMRKDVPGEPTFEFQHALIRDCAYDGMLRGQRIEVHGRIADHLRATQERSPGAVPDELLATHLEAAQRLRAAIAAWEAAAARAVARGALSDGVAHLDRAVRLQRRLDDAPSGHAERVRLLTLLGNALISAEGYNGPRTHAVWNEIFALMETTDLPLERRVDVLTNATGSLMAAGRFLEIRQRFERLPRQALTAAPVLVRAYVAQSVANADLCIGDIGQAARGMEEARRLVRGHPHAGIPVGGGTPEVAVHVFYMRCAIMLGDFELVRELDRELVAIIGRTEYLPARCWAIQGRGFHAVMCRPPEETLALMDELEPLAQRSRLLTRIATAKLIRGVAWVQQGRLDEGSALASAGLQEWLRYGGRFACSEHALHLAALLLAAGRVQAAQTFVATAQEIDAAGDGRAHVAESTRLQAEILLARGSGQDTARSFIAALRIAMDQRCGLYAMRTVASLHRHFGRDPFDEEVRGHCAALRDRVTGDDEHVDLRAFRQVLSDVGIGR